MVLIELSMSPMDKGTSVSNWVARSLEIIDRSGLNYRLGPMGTCIEGDWDEVMRVVRHCWAAMAKDCVRITFSVKGDWKRGTKGRLGGKIVSVQKKVKRRLQT